MKKYWFNEGLKANISFMKKVRERRKEQKKKKENVKRRKLKGEK